MSASALPRMTANEFLDWADRQPDGRRYEPLAGEVAAMAPQRSGHALMCLQIARRLPEAVETAGLHCSLYGDGMAVEIDAATIFEPDALVRCGPCCRSMPSRSSTR